MPGKKCCIKKCPNISLKKGNSNKEVSFHMFPKKIRQRTAWIEFCKREPSWFPKKYSTICSDHFDDNDFIPNFRKNLLNCRTKRQLKDNVIPSIISKEEKLLKQKERDKKLIIKITKQIEPKIQPMVTEQNKTEMVEEETEFLEDKDTTIYKLQKQLRECQNEIKSLSFYNDNLRRMLAREQIDTKDLRQEISKLNVELEKYKSSNLTKSQFDEKLKMILSSILTNNQIDIITEKKERVIWTKEEIAEAFLLFDMSKKAYSFIRNKLKYPLPNLRTLQNYARIGKLHLILRSCCNDKGEFSLPCRGKPTDSKMPEETMNFPETLIAKTNMEEKNNHITMNEGKLKNQIKVAAFATYNLQQEIEDEGLEYVLEQLSKKFKNKYSNYEMNWLQDHNYNKPIWLYEAFYGDIKESLSKFVKESLLLEKKVKILKKKGFKFRSSLVHRYCLIFKNKVHLPSNVIKEFVKQRILLV